MERIDYRKQGEWGETATGNTEWQSPIALPDANELAPHQAGQLTVDFNTRIPLRMTQPVIGPQFLGVGEITVNGTSWEFVRCHFHDGAEHLHNGVRYDLEVHFVAEHDNQTAVFAAWGQVNPQAQPLGLASLFAGQRDADILNQLWPKATGFYHYEGSLTTPPLKGGVQWFVLEPVLTVAPSDLAVLHADFPHNYRDCQPLNGRVIEYFTL
ncbi:carbonic anhydrase family protein [Leuconostocaceae bacterium ESL0723]|nr:carbonic anhydrase family protein [Leuconostocaceae bacterium ESL0723]